MRAVVWGRAQRTAAAAGFVLKVPVKVPGNSSGTKGAYLKSIDIWFDIGTAALTSQAATIYKATLPADGAAFAAPAAQTFTYDAGHDTAPERVDVDEHKMRLTLDAAAWVGAGDVYTVALVVAPGATSVFDYYGTVVNHVFRE